MPEILSWSVNFPVKTSQHQVSSHKTGETFVKKMTVGEKWKSSESRQNNFLVCIPSSHKTGETPVKKKSTRGEKWKSSQSRQNKILEHFRQHE